MQRFILLFIICFFISIDSFGQIKNVKDSLEKLVIISPNNEEKVDLLIQLSSQYGVNDYDKAINYADKALEISKENDDVKRQVLSKMQLAKLHQNNGNTEEAFNYIIAAKELAHEHDYNNEYARAIYYMAKFYVQLGEFQKPAELSFEALKIFEENQDYEGVCDVLNIIGGNYYMNGEFDEAEVYLQKSIDLSKSINYKEGLAKGITNISAVFNMRDETEKAIEFLHVGNQLFKETGELTRMGVAYCNIALYYLKLDAVDSAFKYIHKAKEVNKQRQNNRNVALTHIVLARCYLYVNDTSEFLKNMNYGLDIADKYGLKSLSYNAISHLLDYYQSMHNFEKAFNYGRQQFALKDSLDRDRSLTRLSQLNMLYQIEKNEQERKLKEQKREFIIGIIILSLIIVLILLIFIIFRYRVKAHLSRLKNQKLEDELQIQQKELAANVMSLMKKNEMLSEINEKLIEVRKRVKGEDTKKEIANIAFEIESNTQDKIWEEFEVRFKQVHSDFYTNLMELYPDFTSNEIRLCAFLKLNLTTKEISSITGQSPRSLEVARYRLRKKMEITSSSINLTTHISKI